MGGSLGGLEILVNNVGAIVWKDLAGTSPEVWRGRIDEDGDGSKEVSDGGGETVGAYVGAGSAQLLLQRYESEQISQFWSLNSKPTLSSQPQMSSQQ